MINQQNPVGSQRTVQSSKNKWKLCWRLTTLWLSCSVNSRTEYWIKKKKRAAWYKTPLWYKLTLLVQKLCWIACKLSDTGPNQVSSVPNVSAFRQIKCLPANLQSQADTNTISSVPANSIERWLYVTDWFGSNLHCITQQSAYPSVTISGLRGKVWQIRFLGRLRVALKTNGQQK